MNQTSFERSIFSKNCFSTILFIWILNLSIPSYGQNKSLVSYDQKTGKPFVFAVVTDIQYGDKDTLRGRHFRASIFKLEECIIDLNRRNLAFTIQLGDIIDGHKEDTVKSHIDLNSIVMVLKQFKMPVYNVLGNHDINASKDYLKMLLGLDSFYYSFKIPSAGEWLFVVLDGNDGGYGIMDNEQIKWFRSIIENAKIAGEKVICFSHYPLIRSAASKHYMAKPEPLLGILDSTDCVRAWFAGHDHNGGYALRNNVHHVTFKGIVENPVENAYAIVELYPDKIKIKGVGKEMNRELDFFETHKHQKTEFPK